MSVDPLSQANNLRSQVIYVILVINASILSRGKFNQTLLDDATFKVGYLRCYFYRDYSIVVIVICKDVVLNQRVNFSLKICQLLVVGRARRGFVRIGKLRGLCPLALLFVIYLLLLFLKCLSA